MKVKTQLPKLVIWDFDGVICDSLIECITVTQLAVTRLDRPNLEISRDSLHKICNSDAIAKTYNEMRALRPFVVKGQDYLWQFYNLTSFSCGFKSFKEYQPVFNSIFNQEQDKMYEEAFYDARKMLQNLMGNEYFNLFKPYPEIFYAFQASLRWYRNYICTARDQKGVSMFYNNNGIFFPRENIFSKDYNGVNYNPGQSKSEQIIDILNKEGGLDQHFLIVEDQVKSPFELKNICPNMDVIYAKYGYGLEHDWLQAGIPRLKMILSSDNLIYEIY